MRVSRTQLARTKREEGFRSAPYQDIGGVWTRGYGETTGIGPDSRPISESEASVNLERLINQVYAPPIDALDLGPQYTQNMFDATVDAVYNLGDGILSESSTFGSYLRAKEWRKAADSLLLYDHDNGVVVPDLQRRRETERAVFLAPARPTASPLDVLTRPERTLVDHYRHDAVHRTLHAHELKKLTEELVVARKEVWVAAEKGHLPDGRKVQQGWTVEHRRQRYSILSSLTNWPPK